MDGLGREHKPRAIQGLLTGHNTLRRHPHAINLEENSMCSFVLLTVVGRGGEGSSSIHTVYV